MKQTILTPLNMYKINKYWFVLLASLSIFMELFDSTILYVSLINIAKYFNLDVFDLKTAVVSYFIGLSIFISLSAYLANNYGENKVFIFACFAFAISSLACGLVNNVLELSVFRFFQGASASFLSPIATMMAFRSLSSENVVKISSLINIPGLVGAAIGPFIGGIITTHFYWGWIFFINVPIGLFLILLCHIIYKHNPLQHIKKEIRFDKVGFVLVSTALFTAAILLEKSNDISFEPRLFYTILIIFICSLILYFIHYTKTKERSLVDLSIFKIRSFKYGVYINIIARISMSGMAFCLPLFFQQGLGLSAGMAGFFIMFVAVGAILSKFFLSPLITVLGYKKALSVSALMLSLTIILFFTLRIYSYWALIICLCFIYGVASSFQYTSMNSVVLKDIFPDEMRKAINIHSIVLEFSSVLGVNFTAYILVLLSNSSNYFNTASILYQIMFIILASGSFLTLLLANSKPSLDIQRIKS